MLRELSTKATQCRVVFYREVRVTEIKKKTERGGGEGENGAVSDKRGGIVLAAQLVNNESC